VVGGGDWAGAEVQASTLLGALQKRPGVALHAITLYEGRLARELRGAGIDVYVAGEEHKPFPQLMIHCAQFVKSRSIQILHSHGYKESIISLLLSRTCRVPHLVRTEHGHPEPYSTARNLKHWCVLAMDRTAARFTPDRILCVSDDLGNYWKRHAKPERVVIMPNGIDPEHVRSVFCTQEARVRLGIPANHNVVGIAARLDPVKRPDLFLSTARSLASRLPNVSFVIAGHGRLEESLRKQVCDWGLADRIFFLGRRSDVYDVLRAMDVLLICSDHEGIPMMMLEAMALGVCVVARDVGGISEVIRHGETGLLVPSDSPEALSTACESILRDEPLRTSIVSSARKQIASEHSADLNAQKVLQMYEAIVRGRQQR
jgi:glycosyltransferase involved in cell wall biosynthesis